jgi:hypothetical protein
MGLAFSVFLLIPYILIMHFLTPKTIVHKYFKPPHFREFECALFTGIPYAPMRTVMFIGVTAYPRLGRKRKLTQVYKLAPRWYQIASKIFIYWVIIAAFGMPATLGGLFIYDRLG